MTIVVLSRTLNLVDMQYLMSSRGADGQVRSNGANTRP